ncbi:MmgE/PrpD family protein [Niveispirillum sp. KHB5.9]|uniref:MmgE/PrpD family protein n=1 Tax=Niveispirillum sp. KHB5.9 TaxID=3400269 RepID=UPI003A8C3A2B
MTLIAHFADHLCRPVPTVMRRRAALHLLDWAGCAVIGATAPVAGALAGVFLDDRGGPCTLVGRAGGAGAEAAARYNGVLGNIYEMDDVDKRARLHPGPVIIPAALALAQETGADSTRLLDAITRGYEAAIRLGRALGDGHYRYWHPTASAGTVGAAAACADILCLDRHGMAQAMALAATRTGGLWETRNDPQSNAKQIHNAQAAGDGLLAARMAAAGLRGPGRILEGTEGLFAATAAPGADPGALLAGTSPAGWCIADVSLKPWPACRHAHPVIDAALALLAKAGRDRLEAHAVAGIAIQTYGDALRFCDRPTPRSVIEAKFSLQHAVAVTLLGGPPPLAAFDPDMITDPFVATLRSRVKVTVGEPYARAYPNHFGARLVVNLTNGDLLVHEQPDALGDPENPLSIDRAIDKARNLMQAAGMEATAIGILITECLELAEGRPLPTGWPVHVERGEA